MTYDFSILRELRKKRKLTINTLSQLCGVSYVALSKLERNQGNPQLKTLDRISRALGIATHNLLALAEHKHPTQTTQNTCRFLETAECRHVDLDGTRILCVTAPQGAKGWAADFHRDDYERCFVLDGRVKITIHGTDYVLGAGDALAWDCLFDHNYEVLQPSTFITVLTPKRP